MRRFGLIITLLAPVLLALATGCNSGRVQYPPSDDSFGGGGGGGGKKATEELASTGWATLKGRITYDGKLPENEPFNITRDQSWCDCEAAKKRRDTINLVWVGTEADGATGVGNVVVFLKAPDGKHFKIPDSLKDVSQNEKMGKVVLDQPFCAYEPRVVLVYPGYSDGKEMISSGQSFTIKNSAEVPHNTKIKGNALFNRDFDSGTIASKSQTPGPNLKGQDTPLNVSCDVHPWMKGICWAFEHPFAAATKTDGTFEIKDVPAGASLNVVIWHEGIGFHTGDGFEGKKGKTFTFTPGQAQELNVKIKKQ